MSFSSICTSRVTVGFGISMRSAALLKVPESETLTNARIAVSLSMSENPWLRGVDCCGQRTLH
jgi:hypothetical protein